MSIEDFKEKISQIYPLTKIQTTMQYIIRLGKSGSVILQYRNNKFEKYIIAGNEKERIEKDIKQLFGE